MSALRMIDDWPPNNAAVAVIAADGTRLDSHGPTEKVFPLASVTKLLSAYAALIAVEEGAIELDAAAGPPGATVRHLLAHAAGLGFDSEQVYAEPGTRRMYSNAGFEVLGRTIGELTGIPFPRYLNEALCAPLGMSATALNGSPGADGESTVDDLARFAAELQRPTLLAEQTVRAATSVVFPGLDGVLPAYGHQKPNDWGLGFEIRDGKSPHWTGKDNSPETFGHFGQSGTFLWVDPVAGLACVCLTDMDYGPWAKDVWPALSDAVLTEFAR